MLSLSCTTLCCTTHTHTHTFGLAFETSKSGVTSSRVHESSTSDSTPPHVKMLPRVSQCLNCLRGRSSPSATAPHATWRRPRPRGFVAKHRLAMPMHEPHGPRLAVADAALFSIGSTGTSPSPLVPLLHLPAAATPGSPFLKYQSKPVWQPLSHLRGPGAYATPWW